MKIKILVCYHKKTPIIASEILQPILLGTQQADRRLMKSLIRHCRKQNAILLCDNASILPSEIGGGAVEVR